jgi:hypothetical protein
MLYLFFKGNVGGIVAQPYEMTTEKYMRWSRLPAIDDTVAFLGQEGKSQCRGKVVAVDSDRVKVQHCSCDEWLVWSELDIERNPETGCWIVKTPFHAAA